MTASDRPPHILRPATRALYILSQAVLHLALPLLPLWFLFRALKEPAYARHFAQRLGLGPVGERGSVWLHAASLGETRGASPLIERLLAEGHRVLLTHVTPSGLAEGKRLFPSANVVHRYLPLDLFWAVRLFLWRAKPRLGLICEVEVWPALLIEAARAGIPTIIVNGNLRERSAARTGLRGAVLPLYGLFALILAKDDAHRDRYLRIGVDPARIRVVGELKYDQRPDPAQIETGLRMRARWPGARRVLMIASSQKGEEADLATMVADLLDDPDLRVIWAPRQPQSFDAVADLLAQKGLTLARRSVGEASPWPDAQVLLADSFGEMALFYAMADLVFVGGSLIDIGGHNINEPMAQGKPVVMGPSIHGVRLAAEAAATVGALESLPDARALGARIKALLADPNLLERKSAAALAFSRAQAGAADRSMAALAP